MSTLEEAGEFSVVTRLCRLAEETIRAGRRSAADSRAWQVVTGPGDDCAVVRTDSGNDLLLTSDPVIENVHFVSGTSPFAIGRKAVCRVLSDIAAMGGEPTWILVNIVARRDTPTETIDGIFSGGLATAARYGAALAGGDLSEGHCLEVHAFSAGVVPRGKAVLRSGARSGDLIFVTGELGGSRAGRHLWFEPRISEGVWLREWASAMIDLSDGLAPDLRRIAAMSHTGAELSGSAIPVSEAALAQYGGMSPLEHALYDGEDFELLFTVPAERKEAFVTAWRKAFSLRCTLVGAMNDSTGTIICTHDSGRRIELSGGYEHFCSA